MLGAVVFGHEQMQVAIKTINEMVAAVGKPKWDWKPNAASAELDAPLPRSCAEALSDAYPSPTSRTRHARCRDQGRRDLALSGGDAREVHADDVDNSLFKLESNIVRQRILNGEPRIDGRECTTGASDHRQGRRAAAYPRLGAVHARRDAGAGGRPRSAPAATRRSSTRSKASAASRSCSTTTSLRSRSVRPA
jgi:hypothetical protein